MDKKVQEVIHHYIGAKVNVKTASAEFKGTLVGVYYDRWSFHGQAPLKLALQVKTESNAVHVYKEEEVELPLSRIANILPKEKEEFFKLFVSCTEIDIWFISSSSDALRWLMERNFDVFNLLDK